MYGFPQNALFDQVALKGTIGKSNVWAAPWIESSRFDLRLEVKIAFRAWQLWMNSWLFPVTQFLDESRARRQANLFSHSLSIIYICGIYRSCYISTSWILSSANLVCRSMHVCTSWFYSLMLVHASSFLSRISRSSRSLSLSPAAAFVSLLVYFLWGWMQVFALRKLLSVLCLRAHSLVCALFDVVFWTRLCFYLW